MTPSNQTERGAKRFLYAAPAGAVCFAFTLACFFLMPDKADVPSWLLWLIYPAMVVVVISLIMLIIYRKSDEYTLSLWHRAVSAALLVGIVLGFFGSAIEEFIDRFFYGTRSVKELEPFVSALASEAMVLVLFAAIAFEHLRQSWRSS